jgi:hypothetical protein
MDEVGGNDDTHAHGHTSRPSPPSRQDFAWRCIPSSLPNAKKVKLPHCDGIAEVKSICAGS